MSLNKLFICFGGAAFSLFGIEGNVDLLWIDLFIDGRGATSGDGWLMGGRFAFEILEADGRGFELLTSEKNLCLIAC